MNRKTFLVPILKSYESDNPEWELIFEARWTTPDIDRANDIVLPTAIEKAMPAYMQNPVMFFNHNPQWTIGKMLPDYTVDVNGCVSKFAIAPTSQGKDVATLIRMGVVTTMSFTYDIIDWEPGKNGTPSILKEIEVYEVGPVSIPANINALIEQAKKLNIEIKSFEPEGTRSRSIMDQELLSKLNVIEKRLGDVETSYKTFDPEIDALRKNSASLQKLLDQLQTKIDEKTKGFITDTELKTFTDRIGGDILKLQGAIEKGQAGLKQRDTERIVFKDWRAAVKGYTWLRDETGRPLPEVFQKGYAIFQAPVDYDKSTNGHLLKWIREANDVFLLAYAVGKSRNPGYDFRRMKSYDWIKQLVDLYDPDFAKAMYSTGAGVGDEWVPNLMSAELYDLIAIAPTLASKFPQFELPSNPFDWPIKTSNPTLYRANEAAVNSPAQLTKSDMGTSKITFTAETLAAALVCSPELIEDAIIDMAGEIRKGLADGYNEGIEDALANGDDSGTHFDTGLSLTSASADVRCTFKGLRKMAVAASKTFDTQSTTAGVGDGAATFGLADITYLNVLCDDCGVNPADFLYVVSGKAYFKIWNLINNTAAYGIPASVATGVVPAINGSELYVSPKMRADLAASGLYTGTGALTGIVGCKKSAFKLARKRGITVEFAKDILTQQLAFVLTARVDFQKMTPSTKYPVSYGYNIA